MTKFIITAESGSDLPKELVERYGVRIIPMHVTMGDETRPDGTFQLKKSLISMKRLAHCLRLLEVLLTTMQNASVKFLMNILMHILFILHILQ